MKQFVESLLALALILAMAASLALPALALTTDGDGFVPLQLDDSMFFVGLFLKIAKTFGFYDQAVKWIDQINFFLAVLSPIG